ncbi:hypothetical protein MSMTP_0164 [Methanosarcina sp. MTP4]|nr:hypothetical protein MSMTP_0164 [Methanosarcina sp. MTP4]
MDLNMVENVGFVLANEPSALYPGIRKDHLPVFAKQQHPANCGNQVSLVFGDKAQGFKVFFYQFTMAFETNYCGFKIQVIHGPVRKYLFIKGLSFSPSLKLGNELPVSLSGYFRNLLAGKAVLCQPGSSPPLPPGKFSP